MDKIKELRQNMTPQEHKIWNLVRAHRFYGYHFRRQYKMGNYIVDFICKTKKIIIEIDGGQHNSPETMEYDKNRTKYLNSFGYKVVRIWNNEIDENLEGVFLRLKKEFEIDE